MARVFVPRRGSAMVWRELRGGASAVEWRELPPPALVELLGVDARASAGEIKAAYRRAARAVHPDCVPASRRAAAEAEMTRLNVAYRALTAVLGAAA
jgi:hypothetical protein